MGELQPRVFGLLRTGGFDARAGCDQNRGAEARQARGHPASRSATLVWARGFSSCWRIASASSGPLADVCDSKMETERMRRTYTKGTRTVSRNRRVPKQGRPPPDIVIVCQLLATTLSRY